jgi:hypothetical protein
MEPKGSYLHIILFYFIPTFNFIQAKVIDGLAGKRDFSLHCKVQAGSGAHPASYLVGTRGFLSGRIKLPMHDAYHQASSCAKVKNVWSYNSTPYFTFTPIKQHTAQSPHHAMKKKLTCVQNNITDLF